MNTTYLDVIKKFNYHKQYILKEFIQNGVYPDSELIANRLKNINMHLSIFKHHKVIPGEKFDTTEYNEYIKLIYEDLKILFELYNELQVAEFNKQQNFIVSYTNELYSVVETYKRRAEYENSSTTFGKTLLFQNNSFKINSENSTTVIDLEDIMIGDASIISAIANINNVEPDNLLFVFTNKTDNKQYKITPYNFSGETLLMPGNKVITNTEIEISEDQKITGPVFLDISKEIIPKNKYTILGGKNKIFINYKDENKYEIEDVPTSLGSLMFEKNAYINFYIIGGNSVSFKFNKKPIATNFSIDEQRITNLDKVHHFSIECNNDFSFEIELDKGDIYAVKEDGIINNTKLYYTGTNLIRDFNVIEEQVGEDKKYKAQLKIYNDNEENYDIESIIIKQVE